MSIFF